MYLNDVIVILPVGRIVYNIPCACFDNYCMFKQLGY